jgi:hypothetical protein
MLVLLLLSVAAARLPPPVHGDFDHDGKRDSAAIVKSAKGGYALVVRRGVAGHPETVVARIEGSDLPDFFIDQAKAGRWETWCGKGGGADSDPCPRKYVNLKGGELTFGVKEVSESVVLWTGKRFEVVLLSD